MVILEKPLFTEKFEKLSEELNQYAFIVNPTATKEEIKKSIEEVYDVEVEKVRTMIYAGKRKDKFTKKGFVEGKRKRFKKAIITLAEGDEIDFFDDKI